MSVTFVRRVIIVFIWIFGTLKYFQLLNEFGIKFICKNGKN